MKNLFLFIVLILTILVLLYKYKEGLQDFSAPIDISPDVQNLMFRQMKPFADSDKDVIFDIEYFNNATNLIYGYTSIPSV